jgi:hypothetical protein
MKKIIVALSLVALITLCSCSSAIEAITTSSTMNIQTTNNELTTLLTTSTAYGYGIVEYTFLIQAM